VCLVELREEDMRDSGVTKETREVISNVRTTLQRFAYVRETFMKLPLVEDTTLEEFLSWVRQLPIDDLRKVPHRKAYVEYLELLDPTKWERHRISGIQLKNRMARARNALQTERSEAVRPPAGDS